MSSSPDLPDDLDVTRRLSGWSRRIRPGIPDGRLHEPLQPVLDAAGTACRFRTSNASRDRYAWGT
jgi:hypothetical protein